MSRTATENQRLRIRPQSCARSRQRAGVTLVDLTLTVLILGILAATAAPKLTGAYQSYQADSAARRIEADINFVRDHARTSNSTCTLTFTPATSSYTTTGVPHINNSAAVYSVNLLDSGCRVALAFSITGLASDAASFTITYKENGIPYVGSPLAPISSGTVTITCGTTSRTVAFDPATGKAVRS